jgi:hypothetical protein
VPNHDSAGQGQMSESAERVLLEFYKEFGQWARHYSAVRMTVGTFFLTASFALLHLQWGNPHWLIGIVALVVFILGAYFFSFFSMSTFKRMNDQITIANDLRTRCGLPVNLRDPYDFWKGKDGLLPILLFGAAFLIVIALWLLRA